MLLKIVFLQDIRCESQVGTKIIAYNLKNIKHKSDG